MQSAPKRVLIIEDDASIAQIIRILLEEAGHEVVHATDGQAGLDRAARERFDLFVLDLLIPRVHGYEVIQRLRASFRTRRVPIVVLSAKAYPPDQRKAMEVGADAFLAKPFEVDALTALVQRLLDTVRVRFWGVRGSIATPGPDTVRYGGNTPCVTVEWGRSLLILDAGTGIRPLGLTLQAEAAGQPLDLKMLITHTHWDHIQGFPFFVPAYVPGNKLEIHGPHSVDKPLEKVLRGQMDHAYFPVSLGDMAADIRVHEVREPSFQLGDFKITAQYVNHPGVTMAYRIEAGHAVVTYATDVEPYRTLLARDDDAGRSAEYGDDRDGDLMNLIRGADLYIADAQYTEADYRTKRGWGHSCYLDAIQLGARAGARRIALFSHDPMHDDAAIDRKVEDARRVAREQGLAMDVIPAIENEVIELPPA